MKAKTGWIIAGVVLLVLVLYVVTGYNRFVGLDQNVNGAWSEVENQYQRQADTIPRLIDVVSSSVKVETKFVKDVIDARTSYVSAASQLQKDTAGQQMNAGFTALVNAVSESYPNLQANKQYVALTDELVGTQNRITTARTRYITAIQSYNTATKKFPSNILAGMFGFSQKEYYTAPAGTTTPSLGSGTLP